MSKELKITRGKWKVFGGTVSNGGGKFSVSSKDWNIATIWYVGEEKETEANAKLIAEAGTVANECGLTPRQLMEQRDEALETLKMAQNVLRMASLIDKSNTCEKAEVEVTATINKLSK